MRITSFIVAMLCSAVATPAARADLKGDPQAIALADQVVESIGGREAWSGARTLYVIEKSRHPRYGDGLIAEFWRDLQVPQETYSIQNENVQFSKGWTADGGWTISKGELKLKSQEEVAGEELNYWPGEIYVMYHRFARGDPALRLSLGDEEGQFVAWENESNRKLGTFWVNADGDLYRWRHGDESDLTEYIYGPHIQFGDISFPAWGTMYDGSWSFSYVEVRLFDSPPPVDFGPPELAAVD